jgi:hypothetical protein
VALALCSERGRFLFEVRPDVFAEGFLCETETALWARWYEERERRSKQQKG